MQAVSQGKFKRGFVSVHANQVKKHGSQLQPYEVRRIQYRIRHIPDLFITPHVLNKIQNDGLSFKPEMIVAVLKAVTGTNIIEYNQTKRYGTTDHRVLLRSTETYPVGIATKGCVPCQLCFVLSLDTGAIRTVYWNDATDTHTTMNWNRYDATLNVV